MVWKVIVCHFAKFHADRSNHCGDLPFLFFKMVDVRHLGFFKTGMPNV